MLDQTSSTDELLIVIDHNEALRALVNSRQHQAGTDAVGPARAQVRILANEGQAGLSGARNTGIAAAGGDLVVFLDDDAVPRPGWLEDLTAPFADPEVIGTGGVAAPDWESEPRPWFPDEFLWVVGCSYKGLPEGQRAVRNPIGANMAFRRDVIERVGGFTDGLGRVGRTPLGCEETEFSIRAAGIAGGRIVQQPFATVDHLVPDDRLSVRYFIHRCWAEGISKAIVSRLVGADAALESERDYATRTLPAGVIRGLIDGVTGKPSGFARAAAIVCGFGITLAGYLRGSASRLRSKGSTRPEAGEITASPPSEAAPSPQFEPIWSGELELSDPSLPDLFTDSDGTPLTKSRLLIRSSGTPLGFVELETPGGRADLQQALTQAEADFAEADAAGIESDWLEGSDELVSVVLCTRNRPDGARRTLESLRGIRHRNLEIIVVDNAPSDESTSLMTSELSAADSRIRYLREQQPGLSRARNRGVSEALGEFVAFTDDDVQVDPLWIHGLLRGFHRSADVACVTGLVASSSLTRPAEQYFDQRVWWSSSCEPRIFTRERGPSDPVLHPYTAGIFGTGANFAARSSVVRALGGFDQCLGAGSPTRGGEDLDFFVRLLSAGYTLSYEPSALVWHDHRVDDAALREQMYAYGLGLTAYLTKFMLARRSRNALAVRALGGISHGSALLRRSHDAGTTSSLDSNRLAILELRGMVVGPAAYLRARRTQNREHLKAVAP